MSQPTGKMRQGIRRARLRALCLCFLMACSSVASAQTIRPLLSEYERKADGSFDLVNDSFAAVTVILEARSFTVDEEGEIRYRPLDPGIHLELSEMSFRIPPKQTRTVYYKATADHKPAWFVIYSFIRGLPVRTRSGMAVQLSLPHTVYVLPKKSASREDLKVRRARFDAKTKTVQIEVENKGELFARVLSSELSQGGQRQPGPGFPVFPESRRRITIPWPHERPPEKLLLRLRRFTVEAPCDEVREAAHNSAPDS